MVHIHISKAKAYGRDTHYTWYAYTYIVKIYLFVSGGGDGNAGYELIRLRGPRVRYKSAMDAH